MVRKMIRIDAEKCNGCGACAHACHEGAIAIVNGKAKLIRDDYCDGMGDCLPECTAGAITFEEREAAAYDENAAAENKKKMQAGGHFHHHHGGCPGSRMCELTTVQNNADDSFRLRNWPVQIKLAPIKAPYFDGAELLIAADCTAYAYASFHREFMDGRITLIGCPKLDAVDYSEKLTNIMQQNDIRSLCVIRMEVPCCGGIEMAVRNAVQNSGKLIPQQVVTISIDGKIVDRYHR